MRVRKRESVCLGFPHGPPGGEAVQGGVAAEGPLSSKSSLLVVWDGEQHPHIVLPCAPAVLVNVAARPSGRGSSVPVPRGVVVGHRAFGGPFWFGGRDAEPAGSEEDAVA